MAENVGRSSFRSSTVTVTVVVTVSGESVLSDDPPTSLAYTKNMKYDVSWCNEMAENEVSI